MMEPSADRERAAEEPRRGDTWGGKPLDTDRWTVRDVVRDETGRLVEVYLRRENLGMTCMSADRWQKFAATLDLISRAAR